MKKYESYKESGVNWIGEIPENWVDSKLKFYADVITGNTPSMKFENYYSSVNGIPWVKPSDLREFKLITKSKQFLTEEGLNEARIVRKGSVLVGGIGDIGKLGIAGTEITTNQQIHAIEGNIEKINDDFLKYLIYNSIDALQEASSSVVLPILTKTKLLDLKIVVPSLKEQTQITNYLDYKTTIIDALIDKKEQLIKKLQAQRQAIINEAVTKGLNKNAKMKNSGIEWLGEIPEHWEVVKIGHCVNIFRGASPRPAGDPKLFKGNFMPWITVSEVANGHKKYLESTKYFLTELGSKQSRTVIPETLLLSNSGATLGVPKITLIKGCINDGSVGFDSFNRKLKRDYLYHFFMTHTKTYREEMAGYGQPNLNTDIIKSTKIPLPPVEEQLNIIEFIEKSEDNSFQILKNTKESINKLKLYRQSIISEAVTGKIDVKDWQAPKK
jgi:type I restriction enzyme S subunit